MADRYTYFPSIGLTIMFVWGISALARQGWSRIGVVGGGLLAIVALVLQTHWQTKVWRDTPTVYLHAIAHTPNNITICKWFGDWMLTDRTPDANVDRFRVAVNSGRLNPDAEIDVGLIYLAQGNLDLASVVYQHVIERQPDNLPALNNLAWLLATQSEPGKRDGAKAVELARRACEITANRDAGSLDTLAAAYAETGDFINASTTARQARTLAAAAGDEGLIKIIDAHIRIFEHRLPIRIEQAESKPQR